MRWPFYGKRGEQFHALTGLHPLYDAMSSTWHQNLIRFQAERIRNLERQRADLTKGYQRKIARLEAKLSAPALPEGAVGLSVPDGWVLVPKTLTPAIQMAFELAEQKPGEHPWEAEWRAALAVSALTAPSPGLDGGGR